MKYYTLFFPAIYKWENKNRKKPFLACSMCKIGGEPEVASGAFAFDLADD